jgi:hypothetical protein
VWGTSATDVYFAGGIGSNDHTPYIVHGPSNPTAQTVQVPDTNGRDIFKMWGSGPTDLYGVGNSLSIYHSDGGGTWSLQTGPTGSATCVGVWGSSPNDVYVIGDQSVVYHSTGDGTWSADSNWSADPYLRVLQPSGIWGSGPNDVYVVGAYIARMTK